MKREYAELFVAIVLIIISAFPLFDILSNIDSTINVSAFSLAIIVIMLIVILFSGIIYFISYWTEKFNQLHFKGAVMPSPRFIRLEAYITVQVCIKSQIGTKQLPTTLLNSVITLKLIIWVRNRKNVRQQETMEWFKYNQ